MKQYILKTLLDEEGFPYLKEEATSYNVDRRCSYDQPSKIAELACQLDCDKLAQEEAYCLCLDSRLKVIGLFRIGQGSINLCTFDVRTIFQKSLLIGASRIVLWHNHPSGDPTPSRADIEVTKRVKEGGELLGVPLLDHVVLGRGCYTSFKEQNLIE